MTTFNCESQLALMLRQVLPTRLQAHSYSIIELARELSEEYNCPICEILTPMGEALSELANHHQVVFDAEHKQVALAG